MVSEFKACIWDFCPLFSPTGYETLDFYRFHGLPIATMTVLYFFEPQHHPQAFLTFAAAFCWPLYLVFLLVLSIFLTMAEKASSVSSFMSGTPMITVN